MKPFKKALVYEFEGSDDLTKMAQEYAEEVNTITATDDYQNVINAEHLKGIDFFLAGVFDDFKNEYYDLDTLKYVCIDWTGTAMFDLDFFEKNGVAFDNCKGQATEGVAQLMLNMLLNVIRKIPAAMEYAKNDGESFADYKGREIGSLTVAVRGLGDIGSRFAEICHFFGANIRYASRTEKDVPYTLCTDQDLTAGADVFAVTTPNTPELLKTIDRAMLDKLNPGAVIIDPGQFETFVAEDLLAYLKDNPDVTYWWDVNQNDSWTAVKQEFLALPNVLVTPHTGFFTKENRVRALAGTKANIEKFVNK